MERTIICKTLLIPVIGDRNFVSLEDPYVRPQSYGSCPVAIVSVEF